MQAAAQSNWQTIIAGGIVGVSAIWLARQGWNSVRAFFSKKATGCASGCGKCAFSNQKSTSQSGPAPIQLIKLKDR